jgi:septum formation protein
MEPQIYLASRSPRRSELLKQIALPHTVLEVDVDETPLIGETPEAYVVRLARTKAEVGYTALAGRSILPVLAADTAVVLDERILGKPRHRSEALEMLMDLSGRTHKVCSGVALTADQVDYRISVSAVTFRRLTQVEIEAYWASGEPADKAGAYGIQGLGAIFIRELHGSYSGVMGLPLFETAALLRSAGIVLP